MATRVFHIVNPSALERVWARAALTGAGEAVQWAWVSRDHPDHTETLLDWALQEGVGRLVVWGGDGTFHRVARGLWKRGALDKMETALVPAGTCNDLARRYDLSKYFWMRWQVEKPEGRLASLALGRLVWHAPGGEGGEDVFVNNAGFGRPKASFDKKEGALGVLRSFQAIPLEARWEGGSLNALSYMALFCNGPFFSGGLHFEKNPPPEEGTLGAYFVPARSKARLAARLLWGRLGFPLADAKTTRVRAARVEVDTHVPVWPQADGEPPPETGARWMSFEVLPQRFKLWVP